jgi:hypothetical protein
MSVHQIRPNNVLSWGGLFFERKSTGDYVAKDGEFIWEVDDQPDSYGMYNAEVYLDGAKLVQAREVTRHAALGSAAARLGIMNDRITRQLALRCRATRENREQRKQEVIATTDEETLRKG